jgi:hypothetical protein
MNAEARTVQIDPFLALGAGLASLEARVAELEHLNLREQLQGIRASLAQCLEGETRTLLRRDDVLRELTARLRSVLVVLEALVP